MMRLLSECLPNARHGIEVGSRLVEDLYMDSIAVVEFVMVLNEEFEMDVPAKVVAEWRTVEDICSWLKTAVMS
jgi:acyl carrier protein